MFYICAYIYYVMSRSVSCGVPDLFSWVLMCTRFCLYPPRVCFPGCFQSFCWIPRFVLNPQHLHLLSYFHNNVVVVFSSNIDLQKSTAVFFFLMVCIYNKNINHICLNCLGWNPASTTYKVCLPEQVIKILCTSCFVPLKSG